MAKTVLISSHFDEAAAFLKLGEQRAGKDSAPRLPVHWCPPACLERSCQLPFPRDPDPSPGCSSNPPVELQWDRVAPTLHVLSR